MKKKNLAVLETIDEARAKRVSPEQFEQTWGYSLEHHVEHMMSFINELESKGSPTEKQKCNPSADEAWQPTADHEVDSAENASDTKDRRNE